MIDLTALPGFLLASLLICLAPGTDMAYMIAVGIGGGRRAALRASAGVAVGVALYAVAVAAGAGELVRRVPSSLIVLRAVGALYLLWLAYAAFRDARRGTALADGDAHGHWFRRGLIVNLTNPKMALFFLAFLPQFLGSATSSVAQFVMLGLAYMAIGYVVDTGVGLAAGTLQQRLASDPRAGVVLHVVAGVAFLALAGFVLFELVSTPPGH